MGPLSLATRALEGQTLGYPSTGDLVPHCCARSSPRGGGGSPSCSLVPEGISKAVAPFSRWGWAPLDLGAFLPTQDEKYWSRRYKNNEAAKRSRDARRLKENQISVRAAFLEKENALLRQEVVAVRQELSHYRAVLSRYQAQHGAL